MLPYCLMFIYNNITIIKFIFSSYTPGKYQICAELNLSWFLQLCYLLVQNIILLKIEILRVHLSTFYNFWLNYFTNIFYQIFVVLRKLLIYQYDYHCVSLDNWCGIYKMWIRNVFVRKKNHVESSIKSTDFLLVN